MLCYMRQYQTTVSAEGLTSCPKIKSIVYFDKLLAVIFEHITVPGLPVTNVQRVALISTEVGGN